jgi:Na+/proline symporter
MSRCWRWRPGGRRGAIRLKADDYFLAGHHAPAWLVAVSALSTMQSAATFLGAPDNSYRGDWSYLTSNFAAIIAAVLRRPAVDPALLRNGRDHSL